MDCKIITASIMQIYAEMIGNVMIDARSTGKYYHCKYIEGLKVMKPGSLFQHFVSKDLF